MLSSWPLRQNNVGRRHAGACGPSQHFLCCSFHDGLAVLVDESVQALAKFEFVDEELLEGRAADHTARRVQRLHARDVLAQDVIAQAMEGIRGQVPQPIAIGILELAVDPSSDLSALFVKNAWCSLGLLKAILGKHAWL